MTPLSSKRRKKLRETKTRHSTETTQRAQVAALDDAHHLRDHYFVETKCAQCGAAITCQPEGGCWCAELPKIPMPADAVGCLCANCLRTKIATLQKSSEREKV
jgi:hypothetical protein